MSKALNLLKEVFGYDNFRKDQQRVIEHLISGGDALVLMPTGGGKSLCYQIPSLVRPGVGIIISPLIALMHNQVGALLQIGIRAAFLNSSLDYQSAMAVERDLLSNQLDLLYIAPERLLKERMLALLSQAQIALFAIDEAHCVSQWGHDFREDYLQLSILHEQFPQVPRIALTATADANTRREIIQRLQLDHAGQFISGFDRPNIKYQIKPKNNFKQQLLHFLHNAHDGHAGIIYCLSRKKVDSTSQWLVQQGWPALPYHAGMPNHLRTQNQQRFLQEDGLIIVATIAFGMGIDKPDVRFVVHLDLPKSLEAYYQETGRAGRDGLAADAWMVYGLQDVIMLRQMLESSEADEQHKRKEHHRLEAMLGLCEVTSCRRQVLLSYFDDQLDQPCGNCDTCLEPVAIWDATETAQVALSCVYRTGQRFGVNYIVDVLRGDNNERIQRFGHHNLPTFGMGKDFSKSEWRSLFRQLIAKGLLKVDTDGHGSLHLSESCRPVLRGEVTLSLRKDPQLTGKSAKTSSKAKRQEIPIEITEQDEPLWQALRTLRTDIAKEQGIPPYLIFHDATLKYMVNQRPQTQAQFLETPGVGEAKLERYGEQFLQVILADASV